MRHHYELTDETIKVFNGSAKDIAEEAQVSDKYIHGILAGTETDPFAPFAHYYTAAVYAGKDTAPWDNRLALIRSKRIRNNLCHEEETAKLATETADVTRVVLTNAPLYQQLTEACQARDQAERTVKAILEAIHHQKESFNGRRTRLPAEIKAKANGRASR